MSVNVELYGAETGNSLRAAIALNEAGIAFVPKRLDLGSGAHRAPEFLKLNQAGKVPTLVDHTASPALIINQSNAIIQYADQHSPGRLSPFAPNHRLKVVDRFFYFVTDVIAISQAAFFLRRAGQRNASLSLDQRAISHLVLAEQFLEDDYIAGDAFSMADIAAYTYTLSVHDRLPWISLPHMAGWFERVDSRPAVRAGKSAFSK